MKRLALLAALVLALVAVLVVPPLLSVNRYKSRIAQLMSASLSRPVRLSQVSVRLLPRPCFELTDLTVEEDPAFGAEPVLHANSVTAYIRLLSLWRGRLEIGTVSVDEASFNLVRNAEGRWNLDALFRNAAKAQSGAAKALTGADGNASGPARRLPLLEATSSRINIKNGNEKLPFSILNTDLTFRHESSGEWRLELRGQPARTDLSLELADTGVVRLNADGREAPELRVMPVHVDMDWRDAQLGQLTKLLIGIDPGWRGDLTGELQVDGTAETAQVKTRLRAERVHRAEFAPPAPMDFDANCGFVYHYTSRSLENLACDSPLGAGRIHIEGALPGEAGHPHLSVQLARVPVQAALDALRTVRSGFGPGLEAQGTVSGKIAYAPLPASEKPPAQANRHPSPPRQAPANPVTGSLVVEGFELGGDVLTTPIRAPRVVLEPVTAPGQPYMLAATVAVPAGGKSPLSITARLALSGYQITVHGQASIARTRELARMGGMRSASILDGLAGEPISIDIGAQGPWMQLQEDATAGIGRQSFPRRMSGTFEFHNANWKSDSLANHVQISQATLHFEDGQIRWDPVAFSFGPLKGAASLAMPEDCGAREKCVPQFNMGFDELDAAALQQAILGARESGTLLSDLINRLRKSNPPSLPQAQGTLKANSLILGPVTLQDVQADLRTNAIGAEITSLDSGLLGGHLHATGTLETGDKPAYTLECVLTGLNPTQVGALLGLRAAGPSFDAGGKIELSGFTSAELAASAKGSMHFDWRGGAIGNQPSASSKAGPVPASLGGFDLWTGDAEIAKGAVTIKQSQAQQGARKKAIEATITLDTPPKASFTSPKETPAKR